MALVIHTYSFLFFHFVINSFSALNNNLKGFIPVLDDNGKIIGYKTSVGGADTVFPFSSLGTATFVQVVNQLMINGAGTSGTYTFSEDCPLAICMWVKFWQGVYDRDTTNYLLTGNYGAINTIMHKISHYASEYWTLEIKLMTIQNIQAGAVLTTDFKQGGHMTYVGVHIAQ